MELEVEKLLELCKYQRDKLMQFKEICDNCLVHMIHDTIDFDAINSQIDEWDKKIAQFNK